jgi:D-tyrosyl-tRNA(Tyr) deacylase
MKAVIQRVLKASVSINHQIKGSINDGYVVFLGIGEEDTLEDLNWLANKIVNLRLFNDENGKMNLSIKEVKGEVLLISQFTLFAQTKKGNRPSFIKSAKPEKALPLYLNMQTTLESLMGKSIQTGVFGADMQISLINDGPVTICIDTVDKV